MRILETPFAQKLDQRQVLNEYPRPQMVRDSYLNLNGEWDYCISKDEHCCEYQGKILVPFSPEAQLGGINRIVLPDDFLIYHLVVDLPGGFHKGRLILHFGAVDQEAKVYIDETLVKQHLGGFTPFWIDITDHVGGDRFALKVVVKDLTDTSYRQTGKQRIKRGGIFYTPQSGIWQTVWLESVPDVYINDLTILTDFDSLKVGFRVKTNIDCGHIQANIRIRFNEIEVASQPFTGLGVDVLLDGMKPWTPETPNLYDYELRYGEDLLTGYFGMRKFERRADRKGIMRFYLNNRPYFLTGVLDQGYYPEGLLTNPTDEAMIHDIQTMKDYGFNFLRKHIKIEPLRWYYHCDRLGMIVWQDMINGSTSKDVKFHHFLSMLKIHLNDSWHIFFGRRHKQGRDQYLVELEEMLAHLKNITCISTWVPFNESWGQFHALKVEKFVREFDPTRLVDHASGWADQKGGDYHSRHIYFQKIKFPKKKAKKRILALTEFGGFSMRLDEHSYNPDDIFGYKIFESLNELNKAVRELYEKSIYPEIEKGLSVLVYTQLSDIEDEVNGVVTYDRKVEKINKEMMRQINAYMWTIFYNSLL
ncbi:MAG: glycoside hydrolase family 2 TIM barrel-domain containing protein [Candidatus Izemoplasmatales bacterium]|nr:glycoside hydrolase family 2 TIM barrel-domain containing protein [Candidatus Izemoplasmatales bacterium]